MMKTPHINDENNSVVKLELNKEILKILIQ